MCFARKARSYALPGGIPIPDPCAACHLCAVTWQIEPGQKALRLGRVSRPGGIYFVTAVTEQRIPWFQASDLAASMCRCLCSRASLADAINLCFVVMPDHVHVLMQLGDTPLGSVLNRMKSRSAVLLNRQIGRKGKFWAPGFYDHALRKEENVRTVARYIVANPLRAGLVSRIADYPFWNAAWL